VGGPISGLGAGAGRAAKPQYMNGGQSFEHL
jgi:hypothetical protein